MLLRVLLSSLNVVVNFKVKTPAAILETSLRINLI